MAILGVSLAPADGALVASPTWVRIDTDYNVQSWSIDRGRQNEMSRTDTGTATVQLVDRTGDFDPTNATGAFYGLGPLVQAGIALYNPIATTWSVLFRGFISSIQWVPYVTEQHANVTLELVDGLALLAACEMVAFAPGGIARFGDEIFEGNIVFHEDAGLDAVQTRTNQVLTQAGWPLTLREVFTGNVSLCQTTYAPRTTVLSVIQDACDAEFAGGTANVFIGKTGNLTFHGRKARFNPADVSYHIATWQCGDDAYAAAYPTTVVRISPPLTASLDDTLLYTSALATSQLTDEGDFGGQYSTDATAAVARGLRTWSAENLLTRTGEGTPETTANQETKKMADYIKDNYATPRVRVGQLTIKSRNTAPTYAMLCGVDISDIVNLTTTHGGGGGFADDFYVEGIHYQVRPGGSNPYVELTLDVSPKGYYDGNPWGVSQKQHVIHGRDHKPGGADPIPDLVTQADLGDSTLNAIIDGGGTAITTGIKGDVVLDRNWTILAWTLLADQSGSVVVDIWKDTYANYPPVVGDSITASAKPTLSSAVKAQSSTLTGWTTSINAGDTLRFNVSSASTVTRLCLALKLEPA